MSIAIVFPLVFSITSAYQRRQEAINMFADFRNKVIEMSNIFYAVNKVEKKDYLRLFTILTQAQDLLISYLKTLKNRTNFIPLGRKERRF